MRIVQVSPYFHPHIGGVETHVRSIARELARRDHDVTVVTSAHARLPDREELDGFHILRVKPLFTILRTPVAPRTRRLVATLPADVVHAHSPSPLMAFYASRACRARGFPLVVTYHADVELPTLFGPIVESMYRRTLGASTIRAANKIVVTTRTYASTSRYVWRFNPEVIPNAVDARRFQPNNRGDRVRSDLGLRPEDPFVLFVGRMVPHKGMQTLLEAARSVRGARFVLVGGGERLPYLRNLARVLEIHDRVTFTGPVAGDALAGYYAACDVFVLPSVSRLEAFGVVALEAMATGKPVVVSDIPGVREVITDGVEGLLADPVDPEDLADKINRLLADAALRRDMGRAGRETVESRFTLQTIVDRLEQVYADVVEVSRRGTAVAA